jgi:hypothetical protein
MKDIIVSFSGGATSGFMCKWLIDNMSHVFNLHFVYANTGQEHENTLKFVDQCDKAFGLNLTWVEAVVRHGVRKASGCRIVDFKTADRRGRVFEDMISKYGIPNKTYPHCTRELKIHPMRAWAESQGLKGATFALGIRADEPKRIKRGNGKLYPLVDLVSVTKEDVLEWWGKQPFKLDLPEHLGNCTWCWKKSLRKLLTITADHPEIMEFPLFMEAKYGHITTNADICERRVFFRETRSTADIINMANGDFDPFVDLNYEDCAEECGSVFPDEIHSS